MNIKRKLFGAALILTLVGMVIAMPADLTRTAEQMGQRSPSGVNLLAAPADQTTPGLEHWVSDPVLPVLTFAARDLPPGEMLPTLDREINPRMNFGPQPEPGFDPPSGPDPLLGQPEAAVIQDAGFGAPIFNFNGQGYSGVNPPDTVGDIGKDHYIQMINATRVAIYDKMTGQLVIPAFSLSALGGCATGRGDPIVLYDQLADRWFLSEFGAGNSLCTYVSQTPDPTGAYYSYQFATPSFPDYPKYGVWPDAYYATANESNPAIYAMNRTAMLAGAAATMQRFTAPRLSGFGFQALTPADLDGMTPPPAGAPNYVMRHVDTEAHGVSGYPNNDILEIWAFSVNWTTPANSTFTKIADILTAEFDSTLCGLSSFYCMGMPGVAQGASNSLDPLREVIMHRLGYRNFGTHEALVGNFVTDIGSNIGGIRWFELRKVGAGPWTLYQEGTYAPTTSDNRWMGGIAMDGAGNIAVAYNVSSQTIHPSIRYAGRLAADPLGTMPQGEYTLVSGTANNGSNRYGDYSAMGIDPIDDCTFWFTGQWNNATQWNTRIGAFRFDACGETNFTLNVTPASLQICAPNPAAYNVALAPISDFIGGVQLSIMGNPGSASFTPNPVATLPGNSALTLSGVAAGSYSFDIHGASLLTPTLVQSQTVSLEVIAAAPTAPALLTPANGAANVPAQPTFTWNALPGAASYSIQVATDSGFTNVVAAASGLTNPTWTSNVTLNTSTTHYWRVWADNACGVGAYSATRSFTTVAAPGDCAPGTTPNVLYQYGFESGAAGWTTPAGVGTNTWAISTANPFEGANHYRGAGTASVTDQRLVSPPVALPTGENPLVLKFWHVPNLENNGATACYDGGILEISTNGGTTWTQVPDANLLIGGYTGAIGTNFSNPLGGLQAWCSASTTTYRQTIADLSAYAGQTVQFRMRIGTDSSVSRPGWDIDNVSVQSCQASAQNPAIALTKTVGTDPSICAATNDIAVPAGTEVTYCYTVENTGNVTLDSHNLVDSELGALLTNFNYALEPGMSVPITETAVIHVTTVNSATWTAEAATGGLSATASDSATVRVASISLVKTVGTDPAVCAPTDEIMVPEGTTVYYCYTVTNTGDATLDLHTLVDDQLGTLFTGLANALTPGSSVNTVDANVTASATINATTVNVATWTAYNANGPAVTATATARVAIQPTAVSVAALGAQAALLWGGMLLLGTVIAGSVIWRRKRH